MANTLQEALPITMTLTYNHPLTLTDFLMQEVEERVRDGYILECDTRGAPSAELLMVPFLDLDQIRQDAMVYAYSVTNPAPELADDNYFKNVSENGDPEDMAKHVWSMLRQEVEVDYGEEHIVLSRDALRFILVADQLFGQQTDPSEVRAYEDDDDNYDLDDADYGDLPREPGDFLEAAFVSYKPGCADAEDVADTAFLLAGHRPPFDGLIKEGLMRVAQDMIDGEKEEMMKNEQSEGEA